MDQDRRSNAASYRKRAARGVRRALRLRHPRLLRRPDPGTVHAAGAADHAGRLQGHHDAHGGTARGHREGRREAGEDAHPAGVRGETEPQADGRPGHRLRRRARGTPPARRDRPARRTARRPPAPARAEGPGQVAGRVRPQGPRGRDRRRVRRGRGPRSRPPEDLGGPRRRCRAPAGPDPRGSRPPRRHDSHRDRYHPRP